MPRSVVGNSLEQLESELKNFQNIAKGIIPPPGEIPKLDGIDIYGNTVPLNGIVGGDHIIYVDFKRRYDLRARIKEAAEAGLPEIVKNLKYAQKTAGIALIDVSGHQVTDALLAGMLHQAFLMGALYELDRFGQITKRLIENLNTRFYNSLDTDKLLTMIYSEISEDASFRFLSAGHPLPVIFSNRYDRFMQVNKDLCTVFPPIGTQPSGNVIDRNTISSAFGFKDQYKLNEWEIMGKGDILLLYTDGLLEHSRKDEPYFPDRLEEKVRVAKHQSARDIFNSVREDMMALNDPSDDISIVVIKLM